jgi:hypothetical protein
LKNLTKSNKFPMKSDNSQYNSVFQEYDMI